MTTFLNRHKRLGCEIPEGKRTCYWCGKRQPRFSSIVIDFKGGMTRKQVSRKYKIAVEVVDRALRGAL